MHDKTYYVECINGCKYSQTSDLMPHCCGACGSDVIRVAVVCYDTLTRAILEKMYVEACNKQK